MLLSRSYFIAVLAQWGLKTGLYSGKSGVIDGSLQPDSLTVVTDDDIAVLVLVLGKALVIKLSFAQHLGVPDSAVDQHRPCFGAGELYLTIQCGLHLISLIIRFLI